jgi:polyisoprenoid-binding protein YceI
MTRPLRITLIAVIVALLAFVGGPWIYINVFRDDAPAPLVDTTVPTDTAVDTTVADTVPAAITDVSGTWTIGTDSVVGYRVEEILFGQNVTAVGRTSAVAGSLTFENDSLTAASFEVDMATIESDDSRRDRQFAGRIMDVATYPTATFTLDAPIALPAGALDGAPVTLDATGSLTLRGTTKSVTIPLTATLTPSGIDVRGEYEVVFADWQIPDPSLPGISTEDRGILEFALIAVR